MSNTICVFQGMLNDGKRIFVKKRFAGDSGRGPSGRQDAATPVASTSARAATLSPDLAPANHDKHKNNRFSRRNTNGQSLNTPNTDEQPSNIVSPPIESEGVLVISAWTRDGREIRRRLHG